MPVTLDINKTKTINNNPTIKQIVYAVDWEEDKDTPEDMIIDVIMFGLNTDGKSETQNDIFFFMNTTLESEREVILEHKTMEDLIDNGIKGKKDKEQFYILLDEIPQRYDKLLFALSVFEDEDNPKSHNLSQIGRLKPYIFNKETKDRLMNHGDYGNKFFLSETCMVLGELERDGEFWKYTNISQAFLGDIGTLLGLYLKGDSK